MKPDVFIATLRKNGISFFTGVPDSLLKDLLAYVEDKVPAADRITAANEGNAIALAAGYHLATGKTAAVYMQNSGLGNAANPLTSLADREVYAIPMLLIIGWRGEPGVPDEPQHIKQGNITGALLEALGIPYAVLSADMSEEEIGSGIARMSELARTEGNPCALLVKSGAFEAYPAHKPVPEADSLNREEAIGMILDSLGGDDIVVSTTGKISRELYEERKRRGETTGKDFLTVGSMGHASQIALGIAHQKKDKQVYCLDGDAAAIMHMGALATAGWLAPRNFKHIVLNNLAHESVGGQASAASIIDLPNIAKSCGYACAARARTRGELLPFLADLKSQQGPAFLEIRVNLESRKDLGRPKESPVENKKQFMAFCKRVATKRMVQKEYVGAGEFSKLADIVRELSPKKIFLVTGASSYTMSGAERLVTDSLSNAEIFHYTVVSALPLEEEVQKGGAACAAFAPDLVIAVGGGHVMDMAKSFNFFSGKKPLVAIPTTAGTGSEATQFAVIFKNGLKTSLESPEMLPTFAIVDPNLAMSVPKGGALPSALDALCQAIEAYWSKRATEESRDYARQALELIWPNLVPAIEKRDPAAIVAVSVGAHLSGKAINISKTTACHAFSYGLTYRFGVPHGIAVALFIPDVYRYNGTSGLPMTPEDIEEMLRRFGITSASRYGVTASDIPLLVAEVNADRLGNNPRTIVGEDISSFYQAIL